MNRGLIAFSIVGLMFFVCIPSHGAGADKLKTTSGTDHPSFVASPLGQPDEPAETASHLNFDAESDEHPLGRGTPGLSLLAGGAYQHTNLGWDLAPTLAIRYYFARRYTETEGPESLSPWSVELGAVLPHRILGGQTDEVGTFIYHAENEKFSSEHLAVQYRWAMRWPFRMTPELSLGVSFAQFKSDFYSLNFAPGAFGQPMGVSNVNSIGPLARIGLPLFANDWFALRMEMGYVHYSDNVNAFGHPFNFGVSGLGFYPSIQVSLGYLQPGVEKGVYLPPSALPLWALAALQTEKRSPIIAPPEVLLNAHQAATQGGLSGNILFQYKNRTAQKVELLADFNHWKPEPMYLDSAHVWVTVKDLKAGPYHYVFLVNGKREIRDPWNTSFDPSRRAHGSSVFVVPEVSPTVE